MMGFRLNIATEAPTKDNDSMYMFNKDFILVEGGAWESNIFDIPDENSKDINWTKAECKTYPECFMCDCSDHTWTKINVEDLNGKDKQLKNNPSDSRGYRLADRIAVFAKCKYHILPQTLFLFWNPVLYRECPFQSQIWCAVLLALPSYLYQGHPSWS